MFHKLNLAISPDPDIGEACAQVYSYRNVRVFLGLIDVIPRLISDYGNFGNLIRLILSDLGLLDLIVFDLLIFNNLVLINLILIDLRTLHRVLNSLVRCDRRILCMPSRLRCKHFFYGIGTTHFF